MSDLLRYGGMYFIVLVFVAANCVYKVIALLSCSGVADEKYVVSSVGKLHSLQHAKFDFTAQHMFLRPFMSSTNLQTHALFLLP